MWYINCLTLCAAQANPILPSRPPYKSTKPANPQITRNYESGPKKAVSMDVMITPNAAKTQEVHNASSARNSPSHVSSRGHEPPSSASVSSSSTITSRNDSSRSATSSRQSPNNSLTAGTSTTPSAPIKRWASLMPAGDQGDGSSSAR